MPDDLALAVSDPVEQRLLDAIIAAPGDPEERVVYADWLEGAGRIAHAEFLRLQLALAGAQEAADPDFQAAAARLRELAAQLAPAWRARVAVVFVERCPPERARRSLWVVTIAGRRVVYDTPEVTIGSAATNDIVLEGDDISERHARFVTRDEKFIAVDLRSERGTYVNRKRLTSPIIVRPEDEITVGGVILGVDRAANGEYPQAPRTEAARLARGMVCPLRWDRLIPTDDATMRRCDACKRDVHYCIDLAPARYYAADGACVAIDLRVPRSFRDLDVARRPVLPPRDFEDEEPTIRRDPSP